MKTSKLEKLKILIIDNYDSFTYNLLHYIEQFTDNVDVYRNDEISIGEIKRYDKIVISPGPGLPKTSGILMDVIDRYHTHKSILGVCLGMQGIIEYFGGELYNLPEAMHGVDVQIQITDRKDTLFKGIPSVFRAGLYHSWGAKSLGPELIETAVSEHHVTMAVSHKKYDVKGVQFHPESIMTAYGLELIKNWTGISGN